MVVEENPIDIYIVKSAEFAKPILNHLRELVHAACPDVEEKIKWSFPHFDYKGEMMCSMAAFKQHAVFGFWKAALMKDPALIERAKSEVSMGHLGRLSSVKDLPTDRKITNWIKEAMALNDNGIKLVARPASTEKKELVVPEYFTKALKKNKKAQQTFEAFAYSIKKNMCNGLKRQKRRKRKTSEWHRPLK